MKLLPAAPERKLLTTSLDMEYREMEFVTIRETWIKGNGVYREMRSPSGRVILFDFTECETPFVMFDRYDIPWEKQ